MKRLFIYLFILFFTFNHLNAQIDWEKTPGPYTGSIRSLDMDLNGNTFVGTWLGGVYRLQSGDSVWQHLDKKLNFGGIWDLDHGADNTIFAASNSGIYRSSNEGETWELGNEGMNNTFCRSVAVYTADTIFAGSNGLGVYRSVDGGQTWEVKTEGIGPDQIWRILVGDSGRIYAGTYNQGVFVSEDAGESWTPRNEGLTNLQINDLAISDSNYLYAATYNGLFRSKDQGQNWEDALRGPVSWALGKDVEGNIFASFGEKYLVSPDDGNSWEEYPNDFGGGSIVEFQVLTSGKMLVGTSNLGLFEQGDSTNVWIEKNKGLSNVRIIGHVVDSSGNIFVGSANGIFKSADFGESWMSLNENIPLTNIDALGITKSDIILASPNNSIPYFSKDGGETWALPDSGIDSKGIVSFAETQEGVIYAGSDFGELFRSSDEALTWEKLETGFPTDEVGVLGINEAGHIFAGVWFNGIYRSTDSGATWTLFNEGIASSFRPEAMLFLPDGDILLGGFSDVYRSTDNGETWTSMNLFRQVYSMVRDSDGNIFAGTRSWGVYQLIHGDSVWTQQMEGLRHLDVHSLTLHQDSILLAGTEGGSVYKGFININTVGIDEEPEIDFSVFPNPFSQATNFQYLLPSSGKVTLKIFDQTGREIETLLNETYQYAGKNAVTWHLNKSKFSPDIYFYVFSFEDAVQSGRLLIKR